MRCGLVGWRWVGCAIRGGRGWRCGVYDIGCVYELDGKAWDGKMRTPVRY